MIGARGRFMRLVVAALLVLPALVASVAPSNAATTAQDVANAEAHVRQIQEDLANLNERYNEALYKLQQAQERVAEAAARKDAAEKQSDIARSRLSKRAVDAYTGMGSQFDALLSSDSMTEFSDTLEFLGSMSQADADVATQADVAAQQAAWAEQDYNQAVADAQALRDQISSDLDQAHTKLTEAQQVLSRTQQARQDYLDQLAAIEQAQAQAEREAAAAAAQPDPSSQPPPVDPPTVDPLPASGIGGQVAAAALSKQGAPYVFGAAGPSTFDCSGLTMWAWSTVGVSIPHSAYAQYSSLPHVDLGSVVPGDIIYYDSSSAHVAIYIGGGQIVHARHPGPGGEVQVGSLYGYDHPIAAMRPG
jgi:cell wall-associated NlpC family hydrolase